MGVQKVLIIVTTLLISAMLFDGLYQKDAPLLWLASTDVNYAYMRAALIAVLVALLASRPPRSMRFRVFLGICAVALLGSGIGLSATYAMNVLDAAIFAEVAIIFTIEALETNPVKIRQFSSKSMAAE